MLEYPLVNVYSLLWKMAMEFVDLPMKNGDFLWLSNVYQRVDFGARLMFLPPMQALAGAFPRLLLSSCSSSAQLVSPTSPHGLKLRSDNVGENLQPYPNLVIH